MEMGWIIEYCHHKEAHPVLFGNPSSLSCDVDLIAWCVVLISLPNNIFKWLSWRHLSGKTSCNFLWYRCDRLHPCSGMFCLSLGTSDEMICPILRLWVKGKIHITTSFCRSSLLRAYTVLGRTMLQCMMVLGPNGELNQTHPLILLHEGVEAFWFRSDCGEDLDSRVLLWILL